MNRAAAQQAGTAIRWRATQLVGVEAIYFLRLLILARLLPPDAFGLVAIGVAAIGVMHSVSNLGLIPALVQRPSASLEEYNAAWTVGFGRAAVIALVLVVGADPIATLFGEPKAAAIIQALALRPLLEAASSIGMVRLTKEMHFARLAMIALIAAIVDTATAWITVQWWGVWALVAGSLAGGLATVAVSYVLAPHAVRLSFRFSAIAPLIHYGRWVLITGIVALVGSTATQVAVSRLEGVAALGLYFLAGKVALLPGNAASAIISSVAFPMFARLRADAAATAAAFRTLLIGQSVVLLPCYAVMLVLAPALEAVLGERWTGTAPIIQILAVSGITSLLGELVTPLLMGRGRADRAFILEMVQTGVLLLVLLPLVSALGAKGAALAWLTGNVAALLVTLGWLRTLLPGGLTLDTLPLLAALAASAGGAAAAAWSAATIPGVAGLVLGGAFGLAVAAGMLVVFNRWLALNLWELAKWVWGARAASGAP